VQLRRRLSRASRELRLTRRWSLAHCFETQTAICPKEAKGAGRFPGNRGNLDVERENRLVARTLEMNVEPKLAVVCAAAGNDIAVQCARRSVAVSQQEVALSPPLAPTSARSSMAPLPWCANAKQLVCAVIAEVGLTAHRQWRVAELRIAAQGEAVIEVAMLINKTVRTTSKPEHGRRRISRSSTSGCGQVCRIIRRPVRFRPLPMVREVAIISRMDLLASTADDRASATHPLTTRRNCANRAARPRLSSASDSSVPKRWLDPPCPAKPGLARCRSPHDRRAVGGADHDGRQGARKPHGGCVSGSRCYVDRRTLRRIDAFVPRVCTEQIVTVITSAFGGSDD
jgi:hypothetical protein